MSSTTTDDRPTIWVLGDQLRRTAGVLADHTPDTCRVLLVESDAILRRHRWHRQRAHMVLSAMRHFAAELRDEGFEVDERREATLAAGLRAHCDEFGVERVLATSPTSHDAVARLESLGVELSANTFFITDYHEFGEWAEGRKRIRMEDFYRQQRIELDVLMDGDEPVGGKWNFDHENREPPPKDGRAWPTLDSFELDEIDRAVLDDLESHDGVELWGAAPDGRWPVTRQQALARLDAFIADALPAFGAHEDAMLADEWKLAHSTLSSAMNIGLLDPMEAVRAAEVAYREGEAPINSVEGFIRQVMGWREYVWGLYWFFGPEYRDENHLDAHRPVPPAFTGDASTDMACLESTIEGVHDRAYVHHIERLMVLGNLSLLTGVDPWALTEWMWANFVDGAEWVMLPNVIGMALHADGGRMATKPYASGGAYINKMSDHCKDCRYNPKKRTGDDACPFTSLYWDFLARNEERLKGNARLGQQLAGMRRLADLEATRERASEVLVRLDAGEL